MAGNAVSSWLRSQHICVAQDWIEAAMNWLQEENLGEPISLERLKQLVYEQWLLGDLAVIGTPCLPEGLNGAEKVVLNGYFSLQINSIKDASVSHYSQLQKLKGTENENEMVSAAEPSQPFWEPKASRMLKLQLTDGSQVVEAMEHKPILALRTTTPPGTKIVLKGPILSRIGVLLLSTANIRVLGGGVDSLIQENSQVRLMEQGLNIESEDAENQADNLGDVDQDDEIPDEFFQDM
ncbi:recQ-mediated genome instability protein 1-like [Lineus longissimus]|uniref:recQ-mediated genome instability protein 1-like n=1 Tax=Lineus longissimus TaxID=88925 RepID=UPI002B4DEE13